MKRADKNHKMVDSNFQSKKIMQLYREKSGDVGPQGKYWSAPSSPSTLSRVMGKQTEMDRRFKRRLMNEMERLSSEEESSNDNSPVRQLFRSESGRKIFAVSSTFQAYRDLLIKDFSVSLTKHTPATVIRLFKEHAPNYRLLSVDDSSSDDKRSISFIKRRLKRRSISVCFPITRESVEGEDGADQYLPWGPTSPLFSRYSCIIFLL